MYIFIFKSKELQVGGPLLSINLLNHILFALVVVCGELDPSIHLLDRQSASTALSLQKTQ